MTSPTDTCSDPACRPSLRLFGTFGLDLHGAPVAAALGAQRLLAVLALRERVGRTRLAGMLWPAATHRQAQANLRKACWRLHDAAPGHDLVVGVGRDLLLGPAVVSDVAALVRLVHDRVRPGAGPPAPPDLEPLEPLVHPEAADLLTDWDDAWLVPDRERLRQLRLHLLEDWAGRLTDAGDYGLALEVALCALRADELRESAHRAVIKVHRAEGNVHEARQAFARCTSVLGREIGVAPSSATAALVP